SIDGAAIADGAERPGDLLADAGVAVLERLDQRGDRFAVTHRAARPGGVLARDPRGPGEAFLERIEGRRSDCDERGRRLLTRRRRFLHADSSMTPGTVSAHRRIDR